MQSHKTILLTSSNSETTMSADRLPNRAKIDIVFSQVVTPVAKKLKLKTDACSRRLPQKVRSLYNQAYFGKLVNNINQVS